MIAKGFQSIKIIMHTITMAISVDCFQSDCNLSSRIIPHNTMTYIASVSLPDTQTKDR